MEPVIRPDDAGVGHDGLRHDQRHVPRCERRLHRLDVVEVDDPRLPGDPSGKTLFFRNHLAVLQNDERRVQMTVVFPAEQQDDLAPVAARARRITSVFACVAERVNCHFGSP